MFEKIVLYVTPQYSKLNSVQLRQAASEWSANFVTAAAKNRRAIRMYKLRRRRIVIALGLLTLATLVALAVAIIL